MLCGDILKPSGSLESGFFVNNMKDWIIVNVHNVNKDRVIELDVVILQFELETSRWSLVLLAIVTKFS